MSSNFYIQTYNFSKPVKSDSGELLSEAVMGTNWPVVYLLHGNNELYIGETSDADGRMCQHLDPNGKNINQRKKLDTVEILFDTTYNKSAVLDIEQSLIRMFKFEIYAKNKSKKSLYFSRLQNGNSGQSRQHNYYHRAQYQQQIEVIWNQLRELKLATNKYDDIINDAIFKFSPYSTLSKEQADTCFDILENIIESLFARKKGERKEYTAIVEGSAGTGKTIVLLHMMSFLANAMNSNEGSLDEVDYADDEDEDYAITLNTLNRTHKLILRIQEYVRQYGKIKFAYVAQMTALRGTIATALGEIKYLKKGDAKGPNGVVNESVQTDGKIEEFDILFIDEAHRLWQRKSIMAMGTYDAECRKLYGNNCNPNNYTTLDWLLSCSKSRVIVYDELQRVKESDITPKQFLNSISRIPSDSFSRFKLKQQMRCAGGMNFLSYTNDILDAKPGLIRRDIDDYDFRLFNDPNLLIRTIVQCNEKLKLCRVATGYGWQWKKEQYDRCSRNFKKAVSYGEVNDSRAARLNYYLKNLTEKDGLINFDGVLYVRNMDYDWIINGDPREIGCIHTSQGYDLNYVGVIFGPEIDFIEGEGIVINEKQIRDRSVNTTLSGLSPEEVITKKEKIKEFVLNAYKVMMVRGIKGCYVYACNKNLQNYLSGFIKNA